MLELATLGLLLREPLHGYRLKQELELFMSNCLSANYGAIYPLLKRLEEREYIATATMETELEMTGVSRKTYCITNQGRQRWREKMLEYPQESWVNSRSRFGIKFFFFSHLEPTERMKLMEHRLMVCQLRLESIKNEYPQLTDPYQQAAKERCIELLISDIQWLNEQFTKEKKAL
ncbi:helix-turn-helix transcriptional regulator [Lyngbya aestuarii]|uniref:helix-turn-helix transcriptional regulator n=1 Tax=Lyngbya aestuarii TaxID=118322 RepID=UPI00403DFA0A